MIALYIVLVLIYAVIWGAVLRKVIQNKGYEESYANRWFWWGFFFGLFALIVALTKPVYQKPITENNYILYPKPNDWTCTCGRTNPAYTGTCSCGRTKQEVQAEDGMYEYETNDEPVLGAADEIKKFKELLDSGAITQEEFNLKKKQILGL